MSESSEVMEESASLEELAGLPAQTTAADVAQAAQATSTTSAARSASITCRRAS